MSLSNQTAPNDPTSKTLGDMVTHAQLSAIRRLARIAALDPDRECLYALNCRTEDLSREGGYWFIAHLEMCVEEFKRPRVKR